MAALVLASAGTHYLGGGFWDGVESLLGIAGPAVTVQVITDVDAFRSNALHQPLFVIPRSVDEIPPPPEPDGYSGRYAWAHRMKGIDAGASLVRLIVKGTRSEPVILQDVELQIISRRPPLTTGVFTSPLPLGDQLPTNFFEADLDARSPSLAYVGADGHTEDRFPLEVSRTESEVIDTQVLTSACDCRWVIQLRYTADDEQHATTVDDHGEPFRTTAAAAAVELPSVDRSVLHAAWAPAYSWREGRWHADHSSAVACGPAEIAGERLVVLARNNRADCSGAIAVVEQYLKRAPRGGRGNAGALSVGELHCSAPSGAEVLQTSRVATCNSTDDDHLIVASDPALAASLDAQARQEARAVRQPPP